MKKIALLSLCFVVTFSLSGCGVEKKVVSERPGQRMPDFGQPESAPNLSGLVKSVVGNEVTILKIERPSMEKAEGIEKDNTSGEKTTSPSFGGGTGMGMGHGMGGGRPEGDRDEDTMIEMMKKISTGEEKVVIPVGIQMLKNNSDEPREPNMTEATLADIKQDTMLTIWLDESVVDRNVAKFVLVK